MLHAPSTGMALAGVYTFEIAEAKVEKVSSPGGAKPTFRLLCTLEPEVGPGSWTERRVTDRWQSSLRKTWKSAILSCVRGHTRRRGHEYVTLEHLLYSISGERAGIYVLKACGANVESLREELERYLTVELQSQTTAGAPPSKPPPPSRPPPSGARAVAGRSAGPGRRAAQDGPGRRAGLAVARALAGHLPPREARRHAGRRAALVSHGTLKGGRSPQTGDDLEGEAGEPGSDDEAETGDALESFTVNLIEKAKKGQIDPLIGREAELRRTIQVLCRRRRNNPIYVGEPGVGKTAIAEGLASRIYEKRVPRAARQRATLSTRST